MKNLIKRLIVVLVSFLALALIVVIALVLLVDPNKYRDQIAAKASESLNQDLRINGELSWSVWPSLAVELNDVELDNPDHFNARNMLTAERIAVSMELGPMMKNEIEINSMSLENATLTIITTAEGISNIDHLLDGGESAGSENEQDTAVRSGKIQLQNVTLILLDEKTAGRQELIIRNAQLDKFEVDTELPFSLEADLLDGGNPVLIDFRSTGKLTMPSGNTPISMRDFEIRGSLSGIGEDFRLHGDISLDTRNGLLIEFSDGSGSLDGDEFSLTASLLSGDISKIGFSLNSNYIDLDRMFGGSTEGTTAPSSTEDDLQWIRETDLDGRIDFKQVRFNQMDINDMTARISSSGGLLDVDPFSATTFGGQIEGSLAIDLNKTPVDVQLSTVFSAMDLGALSEHLTGTELVIATGDLSMDLAGAGLDPTALLSSLSGSGQYVLESGELLGMDINALIDEVLGDRSVAGFEHAFAGSTGFDLMAGEITANAGMLGTPGLTLQTEAFDLTGDGVVDLGAGNLNYKMQLQLKGELKDRVAREISLLKNGMIPLTVSGGLEAPSIGFDSSTLVQSAVDDEVDRAKNRLLNKLFGGDEEEESGNEPDGG